MKPTPDRLPPEPVRLPDAATWFKRADDDRRLAELAGVPRDEPDLSYIDRPFIESLALAVRTWPNRTALVEAHHSLSYRQVWNEVVRIGRAVAEAPAPPGPVALLLRDYGVGAASIYAGTIAGRPSLLLDRSHPVERNAELIADSGASVVLIQKGDAEALAAAGNTAVVALEGSTAPDAPTEAPPSRLSLDEPAFIVPTSGSTGTPKLVVLSQRIEAYRSSQFGVGARLTRSDRFMYCGGPPTSYSGIGCVLITLRVGAAAHLINMRQEGVRGMLQRLRDERITMLFAASSLLRGIIDLPGARMALSHLQRLGTGGEAMLHSDVATIRQMLPEHCVMQTGYGSTEGTNLRWTIPLSDPRDRFRVAVGYPVPGGAFLLLNDNGEVCGPDEPGELVVRSRYNALGEWQNRRCVPGRLIQDPHDPDQRIYFTGDIARRTADGVYLLLGRKDRQVKINGQRVEPMEIEALIRDAPGVLDAIVLSRSDGASTTLLAFVAAAPDAAEALGDTLRRSLRSRLPAHMVPSRISVMADLPRLPGGKIDGVALLEQA